MIEKEEMVYKEFKPLPGAKIQFLVLFYIICICISFLFGLKIMQLTEEFSFSAMLEGLGFSSIVLFPFIFVLLFYPPFALLKKKMVKKISLVTKGDEPYLTIDYKKQYFHYHKDECSFVIVEEKYFSTLIIYHRFINTRGYWIEKEVCNMSGLKYGLGWKESILRQLKFDLRALGFTERDTNMDMKFMDRLMSIVF